MNNFERCKEAASNCASRKEFAQKHPFLYKVCLKYKLMDEFFLERELEIQDSKAQERCKNIISKIDPSKPIVEQFSGADYQYIKKYGYDKLQHLKSEREKYLLIQRKEKCRVHASECLHRWDFQKRHNHSYKVSLMYKWIDEFFPPETNQPTGFSFSQFEKLSKNNMDGKAIFYILHFNDCYENFYKFGITTTSIEDRYKGSNLGYDYDILEEIQTEAKFIWDIEKYFYKITTRYRYQPLIPFLGSARECFKCNKNNKILSFFSS